MNQKLFLVQPGGGKD